MPDDQHASDASALDLISLWMDTPTRRLDFAVITSLNATIETSALIDGAERARSIFPRSNQILAGDRWMKAPSSESLCTVRPIEGSSERARTIDDWLAAPLDPCRSPLRQLVLVDRSGRRDLVTRVHHANTDLTGALLFLSAQFGAAEHTGPLALAAHDRPARKSRYAQSGPSTKLWTRRRTPSGERRTVGFDVDAKGFREALGSQAGCTYNDLLGSCALFAIRRFQEDRGADTRHLSLWMPVNVRVDHFAGFGNGSSRIRIYERHLTASSALERARAFRVQVAWSKEHGEWAVPQRHPLFALPSALRRPIIRAYLSRPWVDMGTMLFSHLERWPDARLTESIEEIEVISTLDRRHAAGFAGATLRDRTRLSLTYDPALLDREDVDRLLAMYREALEDARRELQACAP